MDTGRRTAPQCLALYVITWISVCVPNVQAGISVCYFPNWGRYQGYSVAAIDPSLCTHINYAFAYIEDTDLVTTDPNDYATYKELSELKEVNPALKLLLSVGGYSMGTAPFEYVSRSPERRAAFATNVVTYLGTHGFNGVDIDWEFPSAAYRDQFSALLQDLRKRFDDHEATTGEKLLITAALSAGTHVIRDGYDLQQIQTHLDFANVMTYDFYGGSWSPNTGLHSALYGATAGDPLAQARVVKHYLALGYPADKMTLGIPTYGRSFTLCDRGEHGVSAKACGPGHPGPISKEAGVLAYNEICKLLLDEPYTSEYEVTQEGPFAYMDDQWVGYDDIQSVTAKLAYVKETGLLGVMFWDLSKDDYNNQCGEGYYPIMSLAKPGTSGCPSQPTSTARIGISLLVSIALIFYNDP